MPTTTSTGQALLFSLLFVFCVFSHVNGYGLWFYAPSILSLDGVMVIPRKPSFSGTYYVWPGMEPSAGGGVLQNVCDGRTGNWWIGSGFYGNPSLPWGAGFSVNPYDEVTFTNVKDVSTGAWTCTLSKANTPAAVSHIATPQHSWDWALLAVELYAPIGWDFGPVHYPTVSIQIQGNYDCSSLSADSTDGSFGYYVGGQSSSNNAQGTLCIFNDVYMWNAAASTLDFLNYLPTAAYSLRLLTQSYHGAALNVRRSSDGTTKDIGFVNGVLDTATLLSFVGSGNGYVTVWYDQSGNGNNAAQSTIAHQPQIVSAGQLVTAGGHPSVLFNGASQNFLALSKYPFQNGGSAAAYVVNSVRTIQGWQRYFDFGNGTAANVFASPTSTNSFRITLGGSATEQGVTGQLLSTANQLNLAEFHHYGAPYTMSALDTIGGKSLGTANGISVSPSALNSVPNNYLGKSQYATDPYFDGWMSELIFYNAEPYYVNVAPQENAFHNSITSFYGL